MVQRAYAAVAEEERRLVKLSAHEVRAVATSALFRKVKSLPSVLKDGTWRCMSTFALFYLRDTFP